METSRRTRRALLLLAPILALAVVASIVSVSSRGDPGFTYDQQHPTTAGGLELQQLVQKAREPTYGGPGAPAKSARCVAGSSTGQRNPWTCAVRYGSGHTIRYRIIVQPNGKYTGADRAKHYLQGCCVAGAQAPGG